MPRPRSTVMSGNAVAKFGGSGASWSLPSGMTRVARVRVVVRLPAELLADRREQLITHAEVDRQLRVDAASHPGSRRRALPFPTR